MHLAEKFAAQGLGAAAQVAREVLLLIEGCQSLVLIHGNLDYIDAARQAALVLVKNHQSRPGEKVLRS